MAKPNFMIIGASKCGTSAICNLMNQHPELFIVDCKEPMFFSHDANYAKGLAWYESLFDPGADIPNRGEASNTYSTHELYPQALPRLLAYLSPEQRRAMRLIYIVRHPLDRLESYWMEIRSHKGERVHHDFNRAVIENHETLTDSSNYWRQIQPYLEHFDREQIHLAFFEDFKADPERFLADLFGFLGADPAFQTRDASHNPNPSIAKTVPSLTLSRLRELPGWYAAVRVVPESWRLAIKAKLFYRKVSGRPQWDPDVRRRVADQLREDTARFLEMAGRPADFWRF